ncbi:glycosyltransferase [Verrucomicrobia bacterium]|nr:glycosyltransferase [Verrucomicrobiota bacterium]
MSRNLLPFDPVSLSRYGVSGLRFHYRLLRNVQVRSMRRAQGVIFLNDYAKTLVSGYTGSLSGLVTTIPHGVSSQFKRCRRDLRGFQGVDGQPRRMVYVSTVDRYKHQIEVVDAVEMLCREGRDVTLDLYGRAEELSHARLVARLDKLDSGRGRIRYLGEAAYADLPGIYSKADLFIFASECENMPNILLEAMASGLPIACAKKGPMPEILRDGGVYFDPCDSQSIADSLRRILASEVTLMASAVRARELAEVFSWDKCSKDTFEFLKDVSDSAGII